MASPESPRKILLVQLKRAGDVVLATPILEVLKKAFPDAQIDFLVDEAFAELLAENPNIRTVLSYPKSGWITLVRRIRREHYDWIIDFQSSPRSAPLVRLSGASASAGYQVPF